MRERHFEGATGREILPDGRRPIRFVIRDTILADIAAFPAVFPFGKAWVEAIIARRERP